MSLYDFLKLGDKYNNYIIYWKNEDKKLQFTKYSANGGCGCLEDNDVLIDMNKSIVDLKVLSYKTNYDDGCIHVFVEPMEQTFGCYNHFSKWVSRDEMED